jgi:hypothetical protein
MENFKKWIKKFAEHYTWFDIIRTSLGIAIFITIILAILGKL